MDEFNLLKKLERVKAPPDFEQRILTQLSLRKRKNLRVKYLRFSLAGAISAVFVFFIVMNFFILPRTSSMESVNLEKGFSSAFYKKDELRRRGTIPIIEALDYTGEMRTFSREPQTIYILEQVSKETNTKIKY
ncbi:MAG: hypothetical protein ISS41_06500 [Candidatus Aminicenantes bacterium]|nr:hypothetical protein [Candidatus Aminicenantes bacterium]MBL7083262.1 hypothetical protein [Candidatus Aminicenantes bacterium]